MNKVGPGAHDRLKMTHNIKHSEVRGDDKRVTIAVTPGTFCIREALPGFQRIESDISLSGWHEA